MIYKGCYYVGLRHNLTLPAKFNGKADVFSFVMDDNGEEKVLNLCCHTVYTDQIKKTLSRLIAAVPVEKKEETPIVEATKLEEEIPQVVKEEVLPPAVEELKETVKDKPQEIREDSPPQIVPEQDN